MLLPLQFLTLFYPLPCHIQIHYSLNTILESNERCEAKQILQPDHKSQLQFWYQPYSILVHSWTMLNLS